MTKLIRKVPDGGWGWMVVLGAAIANMGNQAIVSVFGLAYGDEIMKTSYGIQGVALVLNINCMVTNFSGLLTGPILKTFTPRVVTATGVFCTTMGLVLSCFAATIWQFILTFSVFTGLGLGLIMPASFMAINAYFDKKKGQAVGLAMAGTGIGQTCMPQVVTLLLDTYGFKGTVLLMGAISLHGLIGAILFQPVQRHLKAVLCEDITNSTQEAHIDMSTKSEEIALLNSQSNKDVKSYTCEGGCEKLENTQFKDAANNNSTQDKKQKKSGGEISPLKRISSALDLHLLRDARFVHIIIGLSVVYTSSIAFSMLFPFHLAQIGLGRAETAWCMSALSAADIVARLTIPRLAGRARIGYRSTFLFGALILAFSRFVLALQTTFGATLAASVLCGYVRAATVINQNLTVSEYCETSGGGKHLASALGLNMVSKAIFVLTLGQFFAWTRSPTGSYVSCILIQSVFLLAVAFSWSGEMLWRRVRPRSSSGSKSTLPPPSTAS